MKKEEIKKQQKNELVDTINNTIDLLELSYIDDMFNIEIINNSNLRAEEKHDNIKKCYERMSLYLDILEELQHEDRQQIQEALYSNYNLCEYGSIYEDIANNEYAHYKLEIECNCHRINIELDACSILDLITKLKKLNVQLFRIDSINSKEFSTSHLYIAL